VAHEAVDAGGRKSRAVVLRPQPVPAE
jgi:hypothetical protein